VFHLKNTLPELGDSRLNVYIQAWDTHSLTTHPRDLFNMNMLLLEGYLLCKLFHAPNREG
jgi:hypothetical protein